MSASIAESAQDIHQVEFGDSCLNDVIQNCCLGDQKVPNVVHYIWYADRELGFFQFLSFMSALRFMKPCLFLIHGDYIPRGTYWEHFISISPNVIHVKRSKPKTVFGQTLAFEEHASDVMRIEALISKYNKNLCLEGYVIILPINHNDNGGDDDNEGREW